MTRCPGICATFALVVLLACGTENSEIDGLVYAMKSGSFYGGISSSPAGILVQDGGAHQAEAFPTGSKVTLSASSGDKSTFVGWTGEGCSGTGTCEVVSKGPGFYQYVLATFRSTAPSPPFELTFSAAPREVDAPIAHGTVLVEVPGSETVACGVDADGRLLCDGQPSISFASPTTVRLTATPAAGSSFAGWLAYGCGTDPVCEVDVDDTQVLVQAFFETDE
jgi:hypothetical protein